MSALYTEFCTCKFAPIENDVCVYTCCIPDCDNVFHRCTGLKLTTLFHDPLVDMDAVISGLHFVYEVDGNEVIGHTLDPKLILRETSEGPNRMSYTYDCIIARPEWVGTVTNIRLIFTSKHVMAAKFNVEYACPDTVQPQSWLGSWKQWIWG